MIQASLLSPEQKAIFQKIEKEGSLNLNYFDFKYMTEVLDAVITSALESNKKILLFVQNVEDERVLQWLNSGPFGQLSINLKNDRKISKEDIVKLRSLLNKDVVIENIERYLLRANTMNRTLRAITHYYESLRSKSFNNKSVLQIGSHHIYSSAQKFNSSHLKNSALGLLHNIDGPSCSIIKAQLKKASHIFNYNYHLFDDLKIFKNALFTNENLFSTHKEYITDIRNKIYELEVIFEKIKSKKEETNAVNIDALKSRFSSIINGAIQKSTALHVKLTYRDQDKTTRFKLLQTSQKAEIENFDLILTKLLEQLKIEFVDYYYKSTIIPEISLNQDITYSNIISCIEKISVEFADISKRKSKEILGDLKRINRINSEDPLINTFYQKFEILVTSIEKAKIFEKTFPQKSLSLVKQAEILNSISIYLDKCQVMATEFSSYMDWRQFLENCHPSFKSIFNELVKYPRSSWSDHFEAVVEENFITQFTLNLPTIDQSIKELKKDTIELGELEKSTLIDKLLLKRKSALEELKTVDKVLFNNLIKKNNNSDVSWLEFASSQLEILQEIFPIHLSNNINASQQYDLTINICSNPAEFIDKAINISPITKAEIGEDISKIHHLYLNTYDYEIPLHKLSNTDRLKAAKKIAKFILSINQNIDIYQLKNASIISLLDRNDEEYFENKLAELSYKKIDTQEALYERLTESILLNNSNIFLLINDGLLNRNQYEHICWQIKILETLRNAGIQVLDVNFHEQIKDNSFVFNTLIDKISPKRATAPVAIQEDHTSKPEHSDH